MMVGDDAVRQCLLCYFILPNFVLDWKFIGVKIRGGFRRDCLLDNRSISGVDGVKDLKMQDAINGRGGALQCG